MESIDNATCVVFCKTSFGAGIQQERIERIHHLDPLFDYKDVEFKQKPKKKKDMGDKLSESSDENEEEELDEKGLRNILCPLVLCNNPKECIYPG